MLMGWELFAGIFIPLFSLVGHRDKEQPLTAQERFIEFLLDPIFLEGSQHFQGEVPLCSIPEQGAFIIQPGFSTAALIPFPHSHSDWHSLEDSLCSAMSCKAPPVLWSKNFRSLSEFSFQVFLSKLSSLEDNKTSCCRSQ